MSLKRKKPRLVEIRRGFKYNFSRGKLQYLFKFMASNVNYFQTSLNRIIRMRQQVTKKGLRLRDSERKLESSCSQRLNNISRGKKPKQLNQMQIQQTAETQNPFQHQTRGKLFFPELFPTDFDFEEPDTSPAGPFMQLVEQQQLNYFGQPASNCRPPVPPPNSSYDFNPKTNASYYEWLLEDIATEIKTYGMLKLAQEFNDFDLFE